MTVTDNASGLTAFLLARLDDDEAVARQALDPERPGTHWRWFRTDEEFPTRSVGSLPAFPVSYVEAEETYALPHIARHDPARISAEVAAKRRIVELHRPRYAVLYRDSDRLLAEAFDSLTMPTVAHSGPVWPSPESEATLRLLALPYADHADYREEWRP